MEQALERPKARTDRLVVKNVADEVLIYDLERHRAYSLNPTAAAVWRGCDGTRTAAEIAEATRGGAVPVSVDAVRYALDTLARARLLASRIRETGMTRRELMRRLGASAAALPLVLAISAPTPASAQSQAPAPTCLDPDRFAELGSCAGITCCSPAICTNPPEFPNTPNVDAACCVPAGGACSFADACCSGPDACIGGLCPAF